MNCQYDRDLNPTQPAVSFFFDHEQLAATLNAAITDPLLTSDDPAIFPATGSSLGVTQACRSPAIFRGAAARSCCETQLFPATYCSVVPFLLLVRIPATASKFQTTSTAVAEDLLAGSFFSPSRRTPLQPVATISGELLLFVLISEFQRPALFIPVAIFRPSSRGLFASKEDRH